MVWLYRLVAKHPKLLLVMVAIGTVFFVSQLDKLQWETDARVYMPKGHPAIKYDEKIEHLFGVKDTLVIAIVNDEKTVYNVETLALVKRVTEKMAELPGVVANRTLDIASLATATAFVGDDDSLGAERIMTVAPETVQEIDELKQRVLNHADLFVGNLVSADGTATMIRAKLKEGAVNRYQTYWQIKGIVAAEGGGDSEGQWGGGEWESEWSDGDSSAEGDGDNQWEKWSKTADKSVEDNGDTFYLAGRPVIEVTSGLHAMADIKVMVPMLLAVMAFVLFVIFKTGRGVVIPLCVMAGAIVWTMGTMAAMGVPLYTISTMLPVILVAVGIGDSVHLMSNYYNKVLEDPYRDRREIVTDVFSQLGAPLVTTSLTTAIGFLALLFAEMPPFKVFGLFTVLGIFYSWLLTLVFAGSMLTLMQPKVAGYLTKKRSLRVHAEQDVLTRSLLATGRGILARPTAMMAVLVIVMAVVGVGSTKLFVNSSWLSDFKEGSEVEQSTELLNERFDGTVFLNIVVEGEQEGILKDPVLLKKIEAMQAYAETLPYVGGSLSIVDFLKGMNKTLHSMDDAYDVMPESKAEIAETFFLYSVSGQPELLDEVVDFEYRRANVTISIKTDETLHLRHVVDSVDTYVKENFNDQRVEINYAGSANNSYIWADLLINSQAIALVFSKVAILILAIILFKSVRSGVAVVAPVALSTLVVAGLAGWLRIPMDVSTALAAGIAIGVGVDFAVHYVFRYIAGRDTGLDHAQAVEATLRTVGRTIVMNAVIVSAGFSVLFFSQFPPHVKLGIFVVCYMLFSCVIALFVLPLILKTNGRKANGSVQ